MSEILELNKRKRALIIRVGGVGDCLALTPVAKQLSKKYDVDYFVGSPTGNIFELLKLPYIHNVKQVMRINGIDAVKDDGSDDYVAISCLLKNYDEVFDFKNSVESNRPVGNYNLSNGWRETINSNYQNWIDLSLAWANIDPTTVPDEEKRPEMFVDKEDTRYSDWLTSIGIEKDKDFHIIGIQLQASTLIRSWYRASELPALIHQAYPNDMILVFQGDGWTAITKNGARKLKFDQDLDPLKSSVWLMSQMSLFIAADSGASHMAEALGIPNITIYTTVPAWTRSKYYKHTRPIETNVSCHPCFALNIFCPLEIKKAEESLTTREKDIIKAVETRQDIGEICRRFNTVPRAIQGEFESAKKRVESLSAQEPACVKSITQEMIIDGVKQILGKDGQ